MTKSEIAKANIEELEKRIAISKERIEIIDNYLQDLKKDYTRGRITYEEYLETLEERYEGKTLSQLLDIYYRFIEECKEIIEKQGKEVIKNFVVKSSIIAFFVILFLGIGIFFLTQDKIQLAPETLIHTDNVNLEFSESTTHEWKQENPGKLESLTISGNIEGDEEILIYLDDLLILNSSNLEDILLSPDEKEEKEKKDKNKTVEEEEIIEEPVEPIEELPGEIVEELTVEEIPEEEPQESDEELTIEDEEPITIEIPIIDFTNICEETCDLKDLDLNQDSYNLRIELSDATLSLNSITYEIKEIPEEEKPSKEPKINKTEVKTNRGKKIIISGPDTAVDVPVSTSISEDWNIINPSSIKIYWEEDSSFISFNALDTDSNGIYDQIEWIVPHLSNQTFEIIIITKALHLDSNKEFISNIFPELITLDDIWSETISNQDYVRVTFEQKLDSSKDISLFPRVTNGNPRIEVYEVDTTNKIAEFTNLIDNEYNKIFLTNLMGEQDVFDLRIIGGSIELDHVIDPIAQPGGANELRAQVCSEESNSNNQNDYDGSCNTPYPSSCPGGGSDAISCNDGFAEVTQYRKNKYGGFRIESFNSAITNCDSINTVEICYEWWISSGSTVDTCLIAVDANGGGTSGDGGATYSTATTTCPTTVGNLGTTCIDVTSIGETWTCSNFFGSSGTRALARSEVTRTANGAADDLLMDVFYFNVDYNEVIGNQAPTIVSIDPMPNVDLSAGGTKDVIFQFTAEDLDGASDLDDTTATASFSFAAEPTRTDPTCTFISGTATQKTYECTIGMEYYDDNGDWTVTVSLDDLSAITASDSSTTVTINLLRDIIINPTSFSFVAGNPGDTDLISLSDTIITNLGNFETPTDGNLEIIAADLTGTITPAEIIPAINFRAVGSAEFGTVCTTGNILSDGIGVGITSVVLARGAIGNTEDIRYCLNLIPLGISAQDYDATVSGGNPWIISILLTGVIIRRKRKKKEELLEFLDENLEEIISIVKENKIKKETKDLQIPINLFKENLGAAEILSKYLKENINLRFSEIATILNRDQRTIALNYKNAIKKKKTKLSIRKTKISIPINILANRKLSILESITYYLKEQGYKNTEIAKLLNKDQRNIWIFYSRAVKKLKSK